MAHETVKYAAYVACVYDLILADSGMCTVRTRALRWRAALSTWFGIQLEHVSLHRLPYIMATTAGDACDIDTHRTAEVDHDRRCVIVIVTTSNRRSHGSTDAS